MLHATYYQNYNSAFYMETSQCFLRGYVSESGVIEAQNHRIVGFGWFNPPAHTGPPTVSCPRLWPDSFWMETTQSC